jgi:UDP-N-acetylmuramate-alanine ligase
MNIHFVGIGGIGVSALAQYFLKKGDKVSGSRFGCFGNNERC